MLSSLAYVFVMFALTMASPLVDQTKPSPRQNSGEASGQVPVVETDLGKLLSAQLIDIAANDLVPCFQRLVCDISARPDDFKKNVPIIDSVILSRAVQLDEGASHVSQDLMEALEFGRRTTDVKLCEQTYDQCQWTGDKMDAIIRQYMEQANNVELRK